MILSNLYNITKKYNMAIKYWTYDKCKEEALKYIKKSEFKNNSNGAYNSDRKRNWLDDFFPNKRKSRNSNIN